MNKAKRWLGEFIIVVVGILVALAVDDWRQGLENRRTEAHLIRGISADLQRDSGDLGAAISGAEARAMGAAELLSRLGDADARIVRSSGGEPLQAALDGILRRRQDEALTPSDALLSLGALRRFDVSDATFAEAIASGTWGVVRDAEVRALISRYYTQARSFGTTPDDRVEADAMQFREALGSVGLAPTSSASATEILSAFRSSPQLIAALKNLREHALRQALFHGLLLEQGSALRNELDAWLQDES